VSGRHAGPPKTPAGPEAAPVEPHVDPRNRLNDLTNRQWLVETKSFWWGEAEDAQEIAPPELVEAFSEWCRSTHGDEATEGWLGQVVGSVMPSVAPPRDKLKAQHPATFSEADVERLIRLFCKPGERVLDPFLGSGSTLVACSRAGREGVGIELVPQWAQIARERVGAAEGQVILEGDAREVAAELPAESVQFIVTSPPYWSILGKKSGLKAKAEREAKGLATKYSEHVADLGNVDDYDEFLEAVGDILGACQKALAPKRYACVIVSDFRHGPRFYLYHADLARVLERHGYLLKGVTILIQDSKNLYPFAIPYSFVSNVHHQYILILQKA
jgi:DNA modification methylase